MKKCENDHIPRNTTVKTISEKTSCPDCGIPISKKNVARHRNTACQGGGNSKRQEEDDDWIPGKIHSTQT